MGDRAAAAAPAVGWPGLLCAKGLAVAEPAEDEMRDATVHTIVENQLALAALKDQTGGRADLTKPYLERVRQLTAEQWRLYG